MITDVDPDVVTAARDGDASAVEQLVAAYLPLVYNLIGRALSRELDVEDTVQETMLHVVRGLPELRDPRAFRSWLVAITMNEIRRHHRQRLPELRPVETFDALPDPASDFADVAILELGLSGQRMEIARAVAWLDDDDRELLSLWFLVEAGELSRADLVTALGVGPHAATVRVSRMKAQLETARGIVRALAVEPPCAGLTVVASGWPGEPSGLWRKRFARHVRDCDDCVSTASDLVPAERLLARMPLVPLPLGLPHLVPSTMRHTVAKALVSHRRIRHLSPHRRLPGRSSLWGGKLAVVSAGATVAIGGAAVVVGTGIGGSKPVAISDPSTTPPGAPVPTRPSIQPTTIPSTFATATKTAPTSAKPKPTPRPPARQSSAEDQVLAVINKARADQGLAPLVRTDGLNRSSSAHTKAMLSGCGLSHDCAGEPDLGGRESAAGVSWGAAGENIGQGGATPGSASGVCDTAVRLTNSMLAEKPPNDGHRANILSTSFHHIGISVLQDASGSVWLTQDFSD